MVLIVLRFGALFEPYVRFHIFSSVRVTEWGIAAHLACDMFSWYKYLSVILVFSTPRFMEWEFLSDCAIS